MRKMILFFIFTIWICDNAASSDFPKPISWVSDYAGILTNEQKQELDGILKEIETTDSTQVFVCIMNKIPEGFTLESYANDLFRDWKVGQKNKDNGVLLAVFLQDRKMRIEPGYGLEDRLTDAQSMMIISNEITPAFKSGDYYSGIKKGVQGILAAVRGAYQGSPKKQSSDGDSTGFIIFVIIFVIFVILSRKSKKAGRGIDLGSGMTRRTSDSYRRSSGSSWGGFSSGGGSSSSGGGFSGGGGGSSGGGGASGSW